MKIKVLDKNNIFDVDYCDNLLSQIRGWMFRINYKKDGLLFDFKRVKRVDLHTLFVFDRLDFVWVDSERKVIEIKKNVDNFKFRLKGIEARYLLELKSSKDLEQNDTLLF